MSQPLRSYKELRVWQASMELVKVIYEETRKLPKDELFGLVTQMRRSAISVPSNIAEGYGRMYRKEYTRFLSISMGSLCELETQVRVCQLLSYELDFAKVDELLESCGKQLTALYLSLDKSTRTSNPDP